MAGFLDISTAILQTTQLAWLIYQHVSSSSLARTELQTFAQDVGSIHATMTAMVEMSQENGSKIAISRDAEALELICKDFAETSKEILSLLTKYDDSTIYMEGVLQIKFQECAFVVKNLWSKCEMLAQSWRLQRLWATGFRENKSNTTARPDSVYLCECSTYDTDIRLPTDRDRYWKLPRLPRAIWEVRSEWQNGCLENGQITHRLDEALTGLRKMRCQNRMRKEILDCAEWSRMDNFKAHTFRMHERFNNSTEGAQKPWAETYSILKRPSVQGPAGAGKSQLALQCVGQFALGNESPMERWKSFFLWLYPDSKSIRHFAERAVVCIKGSLRPLTPIELFAATTTKITDEDLEWFGPGSGLDYQQSNVDRFMQIYDMLFEIDLDGCVVYRNSDNLRAIESLEWPTSKEQHVLLALICLKHLARFDQRTILWPWHHFSEFLQNEHRYPLHEYALSFWAAHYTLAESVNLVVPRYLNHLVEKAWYVENATENMLCAGKYSDNCDISVYLESKEIGLRLCKKYGFEKLAIFYQQMGAGTNRSTPGRFDTYCIGDCGCAFGDSYAAMAQALESDTHHDPLGLGDWHLVEPIDVC